MSTSYFGPLQERARLRTVADQSGGPIGAELIADVTASGKTSWYEFARFIIWEAIDRGAAMRTAPDAITPVASADCPMTATRPPNSMLDTSRLRSALSLNMRDRTLHARRSIAELLEGIAA